MDEEELRRRLMAPLDKLNNQTINSGINTNQISKQTSNDANMTLMKYFSNPTGKGSAYVANRRAIKDGLNMIYIKLLREHRKEFYATPYIYENGDILYYVKVPSEDYKNNKIAYDVLFLLTYQKDVRRVNREIHMYSNSPSFIFTYCYVYNKHGLLIDKLKNKLPNEALTMPPEVRNPIESLGYEKSTYIACRYLIDGGCLSDEYVNRFGKVMTKTLEATTFNKIADPELLIAIYQHAKYNERKQHRKELSANEKAARDKRQAQYAKAEKENRPREGFIISKAPRSKITAKKAQKIILAKKPKEKKKKV